MLNKISTHTFSITIKDVAHFLLLLLLFIFFLILWYTFSYFLKFLACFLNFGTLYYSLAHLSYFCILFHSHTIFLSFTQFFLLLQHYQHWNTLSFLCTLFLTFAHFVISLHTFSYIYTFFSIKPKSINRFKTVVAFVFWKQLFLDQSFGKSFYRESPDKEIDTAEGKSKSGKVFSNNPTCFWMNDG